MERRTALKNIGLSFGALTLTPTVVSMLQSCQNAEAGWAPTFLSQEEANTIGKIIDVMLPTTATVPGASDLNLIQFIDVYLHGISGPDEQEFAKMGEVVVNKLQFKIATLKTLLSGQVKARKQAETKIQEMEQKLKILILFVLRK